jgi:hypothetical protein
MNLFFNCDGNDGRPVVFSFPDMVDPTQQLRKDHRKEWKPSDKDWRSKSKTPVSLMFIMLFNVQMMQLPGQPWFVCQETIAELKILPNRHIIILPEEVLKRVFKEMKATSKKNAVIVKLTKVNHKGRYQSNPVTAILETIEKILDENKSPTAKSLKRQPPRKPDKMAQTP